MASKRGQLVCQHLEKLSREVLEEYQVTLIEFGCHLFAVQHLAAVATYTQVAVLLNNTAEVVDTNYSRWNIAQKAKILGIRRADCA